MKGLRRFHSERLVALRELLAHYRDVVREAWAMRHALVGPPRLAEATAFLPAALALQETPMHPAPRRLAAALMLLGAIALAWSCLGQVDIVAVAPGRIVVSDRTKVVQPLERSVVQRIRVQDGDHVERGQTLIELDPTAASADHASLEAQRFSAASEQVRAAALLRALDDGTPPSLGLHDWPAERLHTAKIQLDAEWRDLQARLARLDGERSRRQAELATLDEAIAKLEATVPLSRQRERDLVDLSGQGYASRHAAEDRQRERLELERDLVTQQARRREAEAAIRESEQSRALALAEARKQWHERLAQAALRERQAALELEKAMRRERLTRLTAPVSGTVQQLAVHTAGGVVTEAQALMVIVPEDAPVTAEVQLENKDIGFVHVGDRAEVKIEAFPYTRYGTLTARVLRVSADAVMDEQRGPLFAVTLALDQRHLDVQGRPVALRPGMTVTAEIRTGQRRVIDFLLSPLERTVDTSLKER